MLNTGQKEAYDLMNMGYNIFLTGGGGVGKTYTAREFIEYQRKLNKNVVVCAPTGIAALNLNGTTLHRQFNIPIHSLYRYIDLAYKLDAVLLNTDVLIIDEISMCRIDVFDFVSNRVLFENGRRTRSGSKQIQFIVIGDFMQLAPVMRDEESKVLNSYYGYDIGAGYAFNSKFWKIFNFRTVHLTEIVRQTDEQFIHDLNRVRAGEKSYINFIYNNSCKNHIDKAITLCGTNSEVNEINNLELSRINSPSMQYLANIYYANENTSESPITPNESTLELVLDLKVGARVMMLVNKSLDTDNDFEYCNGTLGTIEELYDDTIVVTKDTGEVVYVDRVQIDIFRYDIDEITFDTPRIIEKKVGTVEQFPVRLAYAITIHKSQGQTYDAVNLSPYCWDCGQLYVALSRVRSLDKLHFNYPPDLKYMVVSLNVIKFYNDSISTTEHKKEDVNKVKKRPSGLSIDEDEINLLLSKFNTGG